MLGRALGVVLLASALVVAASAWQSQQRRDRMEAAVAARRELAATRLAPVGAAPQAGVSARAPIRVQPLPDRLARQLRDDADFHRLHHRCGVCHTTPDPALHTPAEWESVLARMSANIEAAGLLPLGEADRAAVLRILFRYARD